MKKEELKLITNTFISVNHYMNYRVIRKGNFNTVMPYKPKETLNFEKAFGNYVKEEMIKQNWIKPSKDKFIIMDTTFYFPRLDMDAQNYFKSICDIMTNCGVWEDDNLVMEHVNRIYYDSKNPRIEMFISISENIGIFDSECDFLKFIQTCKNCKRYNKNCSLLKKAKESRIQGEILLDNKEMWTCTKFKAIGATKKDA